MVNPIDSSSPTNRKPLGEWLKERENISQHLILNALSQQKKSGGRLGEILTHQGTLHPRQLVKLLAEQAGLPYIDFTLAPPDTSLFDPVRLDDYLTFVIVPYRLEGRALTIALADAETSRQSIEALFPGMELHYVIASSCDIMQVLRQHFQLSLMFDASEKLACQRPYYALTGAIPLRNILKRFSLLLLLLSTLCLGLYYYPIGKIASLMLTASSLVFMILLFFKLTLIITGYRQRKRIFALTDEANQTDCVEAFLPVYSILVPLLHEADAVKGIMGSLKALDYPAHKLDVKLIVEEYDADTLEAIERLKPDARFEIIKVPHSYPTTKPKACNYAMRFTKGEFIAIYDAEDTPDPRQLTRAVSLFRRYPEVACLQAKLNFYNAQENWLTRFFALEYSMLFEVILPALYHFGIPIPLGGTSNHIRKSVLQNVGGWDAYNVTEDADLGIRLASLGYMTLPLDSLTLEEAPVSPVAWIKQRTRWIKGYMQTWQVLQRRTTERYKRFGSLGFLGIHCFIGLSSFFYVIAPLLWLISMIWVLTPSIMPEFSTRASAYAITVLAAGFIIQWLCAVLTTRAIKTSVGFGVIICYPLYFILHSLAGIRAGWQLVTAPHYWDKTTHGVSRFQRPILHI